jgi:hypothetical protein
VTHNRYVSCSEHGKRRPAYVCQHLLSELKDGQPRGVTWQYFQEDESFEAFCDACIKMLDDAGEERTDVQEVILGCTLICEMCLDKVLKLNGQTRYN